MRPTMAALALFAMLAACGDDLSLRVRVDAEQPEMIDRIVVTVYQSPSVTCDQIAYADLDEQQLAALRVAEQAITSDGALDGSLDDLSRANSKLIVARGYAQSGELLEAGCEPKGEIIGADEITVTTQRIATVSVEPKGGDPYQLGVIVTDRDGVPLENRRVSWRAYGPAGSEPVQATNVLETDDGAWQPDVPQCSDSRGTADVYPVTPNLVGGFAVAVRVAWANQLPTQFSGITNTAFELSDLTLLDRTKRPCAVSVKAGQSKLVCIDLVGAQHVAREYSVTTTPAGKAVLGAPTTENLSRIPIGVFALPLASDPDQREVYAVDIDGQVTPLFGAAATVNTPCPTCNGSITDALYAPACGSDPARLVLVKSTAANDEILAIPPRGGVPTTLSIDHNLPGRITFALNGAGCTTALGQAGYEPRQMTVIDVATTLASVTFGFYNCGAMCRRVRLPIAESAVAFTETSPPYMIGTTTDATGVVLATWGIVPDPLDATTDRLVERAARVPSVGPANRIAVGRFDEDEGTDMIWDLAIRGRGGATLELAYSKPADSGQLQALSSPLALEVTDLLATDVTNDGNDDIIVVARRGLTDPAGVVVIPTHTAGPSKTIPVRTCAD